MSLGASRATKSLGHDRATLSLDDVIESISKLRADLTDYASVWLGFAVFPSSRWHQRGSPPANVCGKRSVARADAGVRPMLLLLLGHMLHRRRPYRQDDHKAMTR